MQIVFFFSSSSSSSFSWLFSAAVRDQKHMADRATGAGFWDWPRAALLFFWLLFQAACRAAGKQVPGPGGSKVTPLRQWCSHCGSAVVEETKAVKTGTWTNSGSVFRWQWHRDRGEEDRREKRQKANGRIAQTSFTHRRTHTHTHPWNNCFTFVPCPHFRVLPQHSQKKKKVGQSSSAAAKCNMWKGKSVCFGLTLSSSHQTSTIPSPHAAASSLPLPLPLPLSLFFIHCHWSCMQKVSTPSRRSRQDRFASASPVLHTVPSPWSTRPQSHPPPDLPPLADPPPPTTSTRTHGHTQIAGGLSQNQHIHRSSCGARNFNSSLLKKPFSRLKRDKDVLCYSYVCATLGFLHYTAATEPDERRRCVLFKRRCSFFY